MLATAKTTSNEKLKAISYRTAAWNLQCNLPKYVSWLMTDKWSNSVLKPNAVHHYIHNNYNIPIISAWVLIMYYFFHLKTKFL